MQLSSRMPDLTALETFLAVAEAGSINAAAHDLGISQQATSARIAALESQTGVQLLSRTSRGSQLTPAGVVIVEWANRVIAAAVQLDRGLSAMRQDRRTKLRLTASLTVAELLLPGWLVSLDAARQAEGRPRLDVMLTATNSEAVIEAVRSGEADLGFVESPRVPRDVRSTVVAHDQLILVVRPDHRLARRGRPLGAEELVQTAVVSREEGSGTRDVLFAAVRAALGPGSPEPAVSLALSTTSAVRSAVLAGAGPAALSELAVSEDIRTGRLVSIELEGLDLRRALRAVWTGPAKPPAGAVRDLVSHIRAGRQR